MKNPEGGAALCICMYKVPSSLLFFFFKKDEEKEGVCGPEPDNLEDVVA